MIIENYLKSLGDSSAEVAYNLSVAGIKGERRSYCACPIVKAIYKAIPAVWPGLKIYSSMSGKYYITFTDNQIIDPDLPKPVKDFINDFDCGKYPALDIDNTDLMINV